MYVLVLISSFCFLFYYRLTSKSKVYAMPTQRNNQIINKCIHLSSPSFIPHFFLPSAILQTLFSSLAILKIKTLATRQERIEKAETTIDWVFSDKQIDNKTAEKAEEIYNQGFSSQAPQKQKHLLIIPGLTGKVADPYIQAICREAIAKDFNPIVYNNRWLVKPPTFPENGEKVDLIEDLKKTIDYLIEGKKLDNLYCIGVSYGSNLLCNYLGRYSNENKLKAACSIGNPFDFYKNQKKIGFFGTRALTYVLRKALRERKDFYYQSGYFEKSDIDAALNSKTFQDFDANLTIKMLGFNSVEEYYKTISCVNHLEKIKSPLLLMQAKDDPISHKDCIPFYLSSKNENLFILLTDRGGHIGWIEGIIQASIYFPKPCIEFLSQF